MDVGCKVADRSQDARIKSSLFIHRVVIVRWARYTTTDTYPEGLPQARGISEKCGLCVFVTIPDDHQDTFQWLWSSGWERVDNNKVTSLTCNPTVTV